MIENLSLSVQNFCLMDLRCSRGASVGVLLPFVVSVLFPYCPNRGVAGTSRSPTVLETSVASFAPVYFEIWLSFFPLLHRTIELLPTIWLFSHVLGPFAADLSHLSTHPSLEDLVPVCFVSIPIAKQMHHRDQTTPSNLNAAYRNK